jgi:hypothetical protein
MKNSNLSVFISCIIGVVIGGAVITGIFSNKIFSGSSQLLPGGSSPAVVLPTLQLNPITKIGYDTMQKRVSKYLIFPNSIKCDTFRSFLIDRTQLEIITTLMNGLANDKGIRVIMGYNGKIPTTILMRYKADGTRDIDNIYETLRGNSGPCPIICDAR